MKRKQYNILLLLLIAACTATAQTIGYHNTAAINPVKESGLYNITLSPAVTALIKTDYNDLRIVNEAGKWVPHLLRTFIKENATDEVAVSLPFLKKEDSFKNTELKITSDSSGISNLFLQMKNTAAERYCTLTGSDDGSNWYSINDSILLKQAILNNENIAGAHLYFPTTNYKYYSVLIFNKGKSPFNITGVQTIGTANNTPLRSLLQNPATSIFQQDSSKYSFIKVTQTAAYHFNEIQLKIITAKYFYRNVDLYIPSVANHSFSNPGKLFGSFIVTNNSTLQFKFPVVSAPVFYLIINNKDNLPVKIAAVNTFNTHFIATAYLEKGNKYALIMGNTAATAPNYDLNEISITPAAALPEATFGKIIYIDQPAVDTAKKNSIWVIWLAIISAGIVLCFFTYKLVKDMNNEKK